MYTPNDVQNSEQPYSRLFEIFDSSSVWQMCWPDQYHSVGAAWLLFNYNQVQQDH